MNITDIVSRNEGKNTFAIIKMEAFDGTPMAVLVEVYPNNTSEHMYPDAEPLRITRQELQAFYAKVS